VQPTSYEQALRQPERIVLRHQRDRALARILEYCGVTIHDVVNSPRAKAEVLRWFRVADACAWESLRTELRAIVAFRQFARANR
jgi:hypothetical protein